MRWHLLLLPLVFAGCSSAVDAKDRNGWVGIKDPAPFLAGVSMGQALSLLFLAGGSTTLACRATDAAGNPLLTVDAITWTVVPGGSADVSIQDDELFSWLGPVNGGTVRATASGSGTATVHAALGAISGDVVLNVR